MNCELAALTDDERASREGELLEQLDALEYEAGLLYFQDRDTGETEGDFNKLKMDQCFTHPPQWGWGY